MRFSREKFADCKHCPLRDQNRVWGVGPDEGPISICLVGEAPGKEEDAQGVPFVGPAGKVLNMGLFNAGIQRRNIWITNVLACRPPENDIECEEAVEAIACCKAGYEAELAWLKKSRKVKVFMPLGNTALEAFGLGSKISKLRGSVYEDGKCHIVPTYHPSFIMRGNFSYESAWTSDFEKAKSVSRRGWKPPKENFNIFPEVKDLQDLLKMIKKDNPLIASDIETTSLRPDYGTIAMIGFAWSASDALVVPFYRQGGIPYWKKKDYPRVIALLQEIFRAGRFMYQNCFFDVLFQCYHGFEMPLVEHDTMVLAAAVNPELEKNLGFIVSMYGETPYWKEEFQGRDGKIFEMKDEDVRSYNARDCCVLHQVKDNLMHDAEFYKVDGVYKNITMPMVPYLIKMTMNGIKVSQSRLAKFKIELQEKIKETQKALRKLRDIPECIRFTDDELRYMLFGAMPKKLIAAVAEYPLYQEPGSKLKKNTKKYRAIKEYNDFVQRFVPFPSILKGGKTASGKFSVDEKNRTKMRIAAYRKLAQWEGIKRGRKERQKDIDELKVLIEFIKLLNTLAEVKKLDSTYTKYPVWKDGKIHPVFDASGTNTGRLASRNPNGQNIPPEAKKVFVPSEKGFIFIEPDKKALELRIIAFISDDDVAQADFAAGRDPHDANTEILFGLTKDNPLFKVKRKIAKTYRFGMNYGSTLRGSYSNIMAAYPDCGLTYTDFCKLDKRYNEHHPQYAKWYEETKKQVLEEKRLTNAFGRHRLFHGTDDEIIREGLNFPIQSTAADILNTELPRVWDALEREVPEAKIVAQIHDAFLIEGPEEKKELIMKICKREMEKPYTIKSNHKTYENVIFPIDFKVGKDWGNMKEVG